MEWSDDNQGSPPYSAFHAWYLNFSLAKRWNQMGGQAEGFLRNTESAQKCCVVITGSLGLSRCGSACRLSRRSNVRNRGTCVPSDSCISSVNNESSPGVEPEKTYREAAVDSTGSRSGDPRRGGKNCLIQRRCIQAKQWLTLPKSVGQLDFASCITS